MASSLPHASSNGSSRTLRPPPTPLRPTSTAPPRGGRRASGGPPAARPCSRPTATAGRTTGCGCGTGTIPRSSLSSKPRTPTRRRPPPIWPASTRSSSPRSGRGSWRPTSRYRSVRTAGGTTPGPSRVGTTPSTAASPSAGAGRRPRTSAGDRCRRRRVRARTWPDEQVLLDENSLAGERRLPRRGQPVGEPRAHPAGLRRGHHRRRAFHPSDSGPGRPGTDLAESIEGTSYGVAWANDDETLFYTRPDAANRTYQLWRHRLGRDPAEDTLIYEEPTNISTSAWTGPRTAPSSCSNCGPRSPVRSMSSTPTSPGRRPAGRGPAPGTEYQVEHHQGTSCSSPTTRPRTSGWWPPRRPTRARAVGPRSSPTVPDVRLEGMDVFRRHLASYERIDGDPRIRVIALPDGRPSVAGPLPGGPFVPMAESPSASWGGPNPEFSSHHLALRLFVARHPPVGLRPRHGQRRGRAAQATTGPRGLRPRLYTTERLWATAPDGTRVPMSVVYRRDTPLDGTRPVSSTATGPTSTASIPSSRPSG